MQARCLADETHYRNEAKILAGEREREREREREAGREPLRWRGT